MSKSIINCDFYIPVKDGEKYIRKCIESILNQTVSPQSITVYLNKFSTDKTEAICKEYPVNIRDVEVPLSDARNLALKELKAPWIGSCDADVVLEPAWLERLWEHHHQGYTMLSGQTRERVLTVGDYFRSILSPHHWGSVDVINPYMFAPDMIANRHRLLEMGSYRTGLVNYEDSDMSRRLKKAGDTIFYCAEAHATHHREDTLHSWLNQRYAHSFERQKELVKTLEGFKEKIRNTISLTTTLCGKIKEEVDHLKLAILMPLHHFLKDQEWATNNKVDLGKVSSTDYAELNAIRSLCGFEISAYLNQLETLPTTQASLFFWDTYLTFIQALTQHSALKTIFPAAQNWKTTENNTYAIPENAWADMIKSTREETERLFKKTNLTFFDLEQNPTLKNVSEGIIGFRQKIYPDKHSVYRCVDIAEMLAKNSFRLYWTETFQGSSVISFGK